MDALPDTTVVRRESDIGPLVSKTYALPIALRPLHTVKAIIHLCLELNEDAVNMIHIFCNFHIQNAERQEERI